MKASQMLSTTLTVGVLIAAFASQADAQSARRYAAMEKCIAQAQAQWPQTGNDSNMRARTASYKSCMFSQGLRP